MQLLNFSKTDHYKSMLWIIRWSAITLIGVLLFTHIIVRVFQVSALGALGLLLAVLLFLFFVGALYWFLIDFKRIKAYLDKSNYKRSLIWILIGNLFTCLLTSILFLLCRDTFLSSVRISPQLFHEAYTFTDFSKSFGVPIVAVVILLIGLISVIDISGIKWIMKKTPNKAVPIFVRITYVIAPLSILWVIPIAIWLNY